MHLLKKFRGQGGGKKSVSGPMEDGVRRCLFKKCACAKKVTGLKGSIKRRRVKEGRFPKDRVYKH